MPGVAGEPALVEIADLEAVAGRGDDRTETGPVLQFDPAAALHKGVDQVPARFRQCLGCCEVGICIGDLLLGIQRVECLACLRKRNPRVENPALRVGYLAFACRASRARLFIRSPISDDCFARLAIAFNCSTDIPDKACDSLSDVGAALDGSCCLREGIADRSFRVGLPGQILLNRGVFLHPLLVGVLVQDIPGAADRLAALQQGIEGGLVLAQALDRHIHNTSALKEQRFRDLLFAEQALLRARGGLCRGLARNLFGLEHVDRLQALQEAENVGMGRLVRDGIADRRRVPHRGLLVDHHPESVVGQVADTLGIPHQRRIARKVHVLGGQRRQGAHDLGRVDHLLGVCVALDRRLPDVLQGGLDHDILRRVAIDLAPDDHRHLDILPLGAEPLGETKPLVPVCDHPASVSIFEDNGRSGARGVPCPDAGKAIRHARLVAARLVLEGLGVGFDPGQVVVAQDLDRPRRRTPCLIAIGRIHIRSRNARRDCLVVTRTCLPRFWRRRVGLRGRIRLDNLCLRLISIEPDPDRAARGLAIVADLGHVLVLGHIRLCRGALGGHWCAWRGFGGDRCRWGFLRLLRPLRGRGARCRGVGRNRCGRDRLCGNGWLKRSAALDLLHDRLAIVDHVIRNRAGTVFRGQARAVQALLVFVFALRRDRSVGRNHHAHAAAEDRADQGRLARALECFLVRIVYALHGQVVRDLGHCLLHAFFSGGHEGVGQASCEGARDFPAGLGRDQIERATDRQNLRCADDGADIGRRPGLFLGRPVLKRTAIHGRRVERGAYRAAADNSCRQRDRHEPGQVAGALGQLRHQPLVELRVWRAEQVEAGLPDRLAALVERPVLGVRLDFPIGHPDERLIGRDLALFRRDDFRNSGPVLFAHVRRSAQPVLSQRDLFSGARHFLVSEQCRRIRVASASHGKRLRDRSRDLGKAARRPLAEIRYRLPGPVLARSHLPIGGAAKVIGWHVQHRVEPAARLRTGRSQRRSRRFLSLREHVPIIFAGDGEIAPIIHYGRTLTTPLLSINLVPGGSFIASSTVRMTGRPSFWGGVCPAQASLASCPVVALLPMTERLVSGRGWSIGAVEPDISSGWSSGVAIGSPSADAKPNSVRTLG